MREISWEISEAEPFVSLSGAALRARLLAAGAEGAPHFRKDRKVAQVAKRKKQPKRSGKSIARTLLIGIVVIAAIGGLAWSGWYVWNDYLEQHAAEEEHLTVIREVVTEGSEVDNPNNIDENLLRQVDFDSLQATNSEVSNWLYVPDTGIDGVVMQESTVGYYRYNLYSMYRTYNGCGEFLTPARTSKEHDARLMILGHRMNNYNGEWMFSQLPTRWGDADGAQEYPYIYVYSPATEDTPAHSTRYRVWAGCDAWASDEIYDMPYILGSDSYAEMLEHVANGIARYQIGDAPDKDTETLMLSTCNRPDGGALRRFALFCVPDAQYYYDSGTYVNCADQKAESKWKTANDQTADANLAAYQAVVEAAQKAETERKAAEQQAQLQAVTTDGTTSAQSSAESGANVGAGSSDD